MRVVDINVHAQKLDQGYFRVREKFLLQTGIDRVTMSGEVTGRIANFGPIFLSASFY